MKNPGVRALICLIIVPVSVTGTLGTPATVSQSKQHHWVSVMPLRMARFDHSATLLPNGKVLVVGGFAGDSTLSSCELFNPNTSRWAATGSLNRPRQHACAILLKNGKVLALAGGALVSGLYDSPAELYDPATGLWSLTASLKTGRLYPATVLLSDGRVLVAGGTDGRGSLSSVEIYDPVTGTWNQAANLKSEDLDATATLLTDGRVLVAGGTARPGSANAELYDPKRNTWTATGGMSINRAFHSATLLANGQVLVEEGAEYPFSADKQNRVSVELYDPLAGKWHRTGSVHTDRHDHTATLLPNGKVLITGGDSFTSDGGVLAGGGRLASTEVYNPATGAWTDWESMNQPRSFHTATLLPNGKLLVIGGLSHNVSLSSVEMIDVRNLN
ncbi:MAG TPA: kelch repeat-containing protein [Blastocatellia bacterium]